MVFLGLLFEKDDEEKIKNKSCNGVLQNQVNTFQWNCIDGFIQNDVEKFRIINMLPVGTFPRQYKQFYLNTKKWIYADREHIQLGSINLPIIKQISRYFACKKMLNKLNDKEILIYSTYLPFLKAIKSLDSTYNVTLIVPDLPVYYDYSNVSILRKLLRRINNYFIESCLERVDRFVLLTEHMKIPLKVGDRPYIVMEGICSNEHLRCADNLQSEKKIVLYTGSLARKFGIEVLLEAFSLIGNSNYELWICGSGDGKDKVIDASKYDERIKYFGYVSKTKIFELKSKATVLVNPRQNIDDYTKFSFPSKTMEYLLSGIPVVAYKLDGIPDEYDPFLNYAKDNYPQTLADLLIDVCEDKDYKYKMISKKAADYILTNKNYIKQAERILKLINL